MDALTFIKIVSLGVSTGIILGLMHNFAYSVTGALYANTRKLVSLE